MKIPAAVRALLTGPNSRRRMAWALLVALAPTLMYAGHWNVHVELPGGYYLGIPGGRQETAGDDEAHHRHCHGDSASCSEAPLTGGASVGHLAEATPVLTGAAPVAVLAAAGWRPTSSLSPAPELLPPRGAVFA